MRNEIAHRILVSWGYFDIRVGDLDPKTYFDRRLGGKNKSYKTQQAVAHAYRLADIALEVMWTH